MPLQSRKKTVIILLDKIVATLTSIIIINLSNFYISAAPIITSITIASRIGK